MIMTLSMKKIVESRNRRGGASLHRNLLVAGVLFKARDVLLAESTVTAVADSVEEPSATDDFIANRDVERKSSDDDEIESERTVTEMTSLSSSSSPTVADVCSRLDGKENVPPSNQPASVVAPDHPRCDDIQPSTDKPRAVKRASRDVVDDDVTPCKTTRADTSLEQPDHGGLREADMGAAQDDNDVTHSDELCRRTCPSTPVSPSSLCRPELPSVVRRATTVYLDSRLVLSMADPLLVRPLLVVQVV